MLTEATLTTSLRKYIVSRGGWAKKAHGGPQMKGWPDIVAVYRGYPVFLEVKLPGKEGTLTGIQANTLKELKTAGAISRMVTHKDQVKAILDAIDKARDDH